MFAAFNFAIPFPATFGLLSTMAITARLIFAAIKASAQGGVLP